MFSTFILVVYLDNNLRNKLNFETTAMRIFDRKIKFSLQYQDGSDKYFASQYKI